MSQIMIEGKPYTPNRYGNYWERKAHRLQQAKLKADKKSAVSGTQSIIADSVEPFRVGAMDDAEFRMSRWIEGCKAQLEAAGWDIAVAAPRPRSNMPRAEYMRMKGLRESLYSITKIDESRYPNGRRYGMNDPEYVVLCEDRIKALLHSTRVQTSLSFDAYVAKLAMKCGPGVVLAECSGGSIWNDSLLTVAYEDGRRVIWHTMCILNVSVLGKVFNQWPTRVWKGHGR